jgi:hypothetical protein
VFQTRETELGTANRRWWGIPLEGQRAT